MNKNLLKIIFFHIAGCWVWVNIVTMLFDPGVYKVIALFVGGYVWLSYLIRYYFPRKKETIQRKDDDDDDNEVEFKDL